MDTKKEDVILYVACSILVICILGLWFLLDQDKISYSLIELKEMSQYSFVILGIIFALIIIHFGSSKIDNIIKMAYETKEEYKERLSDYLTLKLYKEISFNFLIGLAIAAQVISAVLLYIFKSEGDVTCIIVLAGFLLTICAFAVITLSVLLKLQSNETKKDKKEINEMIEKAEKNKRAGEK